MTLISKKAAVENERGAERLVFANRAFKLTVPALKDLKDFWPMHFPKVSHQHGPTLAFPLSLQWGFRCLKIQTSPIT